MLQWTYQQRRTQTLLLSLYPRRHPSVFHIAVLMKRCCAPPDRWCQGLVFELVLVRVVHFVLNTNSRLVTVNGFWTVLFYLSWGELYGTRATWISHWQWAAVLIHASNLYSLEIYAYYQIARVCFSVSKWFWNENEWHQRAEALDPFKKKGLNCINQRARTIEKGKCCSHGKYSENHCSWSLGAFPPIRQHARQIVAIGD